VVPQKSVRAIIEVKSTLTSSTLAEGLELLAEIADWRNFPAPIFKGIFAFGADYSGVQAIAQTIKKFYTTTEAGMPRHKIDYLFEAVNSVCVLNQSCLVTDVFDYSFKDLSIAPRIYSVLSDVKDLFPYTLTFFNELFTYLDVEKLAKKVNINYFREIDNDLIYKLETLIYDTDWQPTRRFQNEHNNDFESIWKRVSDVINWKAGAYTVQELEEIYFGDEYQPKDYKLRAKTL